MKNRQRLGLLILGVVLGVFALVLVPQLLRPSHTVSAAQAGAAPAADQAAPPQSDAPNAPAPPVDLSPLQPANVPVAHLTGPAPGAVPGNTRTGQARVADMPVYNFDLSGVQPASDLVAARQQAAQPLGASGSLRLAPDVGSLGNDNVFVSLSPDVIPLSTNTPILAMVATGFRPLEPIAIWTGNRSAGYAQANGDGALLASFTSPSGLGYIWVRVQGLFSGKMGAGSFQVSNYAPSVPGLAVGPHAVRPGDNLYMLGVRYAASQVGTVARNNNVLNQQVQIDANGRTAPIVYAVPANPDGDAVYNVYQTIAGADTLAGQSIEERADAGVEGDNNLSRVFIDRPVLSSTVTTYVGLVGEGFLPGETVNLVRQPSNPLGSTTVDANGAATFFVQTDPGATVYDLHLTGLTSGRIGYGALLVDPKAYNVPTTIMAPSRSTGGGNITALFTRYPPHVQLALKIDDIVVGAVDSGNGGFGSVTRAKPNTAPIVHDYAFSETFGLSISSAPLAMVRTGAIHGTVLDSGSGRPIKALLRVSGDNGATVFSDPTAGGVYTITVPVGNANVTVQPSGCYDPQSLPVTVLTDTAVTLNFSVARSTNDRDGYTCYQNAGRAFQAAPNQLFGNTFNDTAANFTLPFPVRFYDSDVTTGTISSNGFITLGNQFVCPPNCYHTNTGIPSAGQPNGIVAANWTHLAGYANDPQSGVYSGVVGTAPNRTFIVEWRNVRNYNDGTNTTNTFEIQIPEGINGNASDIYLVYPTFTLGQSDGNSGTIGSEDYTGYTGKQVQSNTPGGLSQELTNYLWAGESIRIWKSVVPTFTPTPTITRTPTTTRSATITPTPTVETCRPDGNYVQTYGPGATIDPGSTDIGNHGDNVDTVISLPFAYSFYTGTFTTADISSNGVLQFTSPGGTTSPNNASLPNNGLHDAIAAYWDDLRTDGSGGVGVFTSVSGSQPNRIFNIEWRACVFTAGGCGGIDTNFEIRLYEGQQRLDIIYGSPLLQGGNSATVGVQKGTGAQYRQYSFNQAILYPGFRVTYTQVLCNTPTPANTPTTTRSPTRTPTITPIPTLPQGTPTPVSLCGPVPVHFFVAMMDGVHAVPPNTSQGTGRGDFSLDSATNQMTYHITFQNLASSETGAVVGLGGPGVPGTTITTIPAGNPADGSFSFPAADLAALYSGNVYVQINSTNFPGGEIRNQLAEQCVTTPSPTPLGGSTPIPSPTVPPTRTPLPGETWTPVPTHTAGPSPTPNTCTINFNDVHTNDFFYEPVQYLYCRAIITGYGCGGPGEPCPGRYFRPYSNTTRAQFSKMVVLGRGWAITTPTTPTFRDVPTTYGFYGTIETAYAHGLITGYGCGGPGEPCPGRYFRPTNSITRAQISKLIVLSMGWQLLHPATPTFRDVPSTDGYYEVVETAFAHNVISGYSCGGTCREFHPYAEATRGQLSKMLWVALTNP